MHSHHKMFIDVDTRAVLNFGGIGAYAGAGVKVTGVSEHPSAEV